jgi:hypothetical protein
MQRCFHVRTVQLSMSATSVVSNSSMRLIHIGVSLDGDFDYAGLVVSPSWACWRAIGRRGLEPRSGLRLMKR